MRSAQLACLCCLALAAASETRISECGADADPSCVTDKDSAALLQSTVQIHGVASASKQGLDAEGSDPCTAHNGNKGACNKADGCYWFYQKDQCKNTLPEMYVGGDPNDFGWQAKKNGGFGTVGQTKMAYRPEYRTTSRLVAATNVWEPCGGDDHDNCWYGEGSRDLKFKLSDSKYSKIAVEVNVNCANDETVEVAYDVHNNNDKNNKNTDLKVWYNLQPLTQWSSSGNKPTRHSVSPTIKKDDASPTLRVEVSRAGSGDAEGEAVIKIKNIKATFDSCMIKKEEHAQCLREISGVTSDLRSDHQKQKDCIGGDTSINGCEDWLGCLTDDDKEIISKVAGASGASLAQEHAIVSQNRSKGWAPCGSGSAETCVNPSTFDIEAFDCTCVDWLKQPSTTEAELKSAACAHKHVCCSWKELHGCPQTSLLQLGDAEHDRQEHENAITLRLQKDSQQVVSLDESVTGKRCAD